MQTADRTFTAIHGRPDSIHQDFDMIPTGVCYGSITYRITAVPIDVPLCDIIRVLQSQLNFRPSAQAQYELDWSTLALAARR